MNEPLFWAGLLGLALFAASVRALRGRPFLPGRAVSLGPMARTLAVVGAIALVFHCSAMFFAPWVSAVAPLRPLVMHVNAMGVASQVAYWVPAAALLVAWRRVWWPALVLMVALFAGVGITMYWPYPLIVHLSWLAAVIIAGVGVAMALTGSRAAPRTA